MQPTSFVPSTANFLWFSIFSFSNSNSTLFFPRLINSRENELAKIISLLQKNLRNEDFLSFISSFFKNNHIRTCLRVWTAPCANASIAPRIVYVILCRCLPAECSLQFHQILWILLLSLTTKGWEISLFVDLTRFNVVPFRFPLLGEK